jgi:hypothetical protein
MKTRTSLVTAACAALALAAVQIQARPQATPAGATVQQLAYLQASNIEASDHFGCGGSLPGHTGNAVAISRDGATVAVGAPHESGGARGINGNQQDNSTYGAGAVYVFMRRGGALTQQAYIKASNPGRNDMFGLSVALSRDGSTLVVAAPWESSASTGVNGREDDDSLPQAGAVYVFTRAGETWSQQAYLKASNTGRKGEGDDIEGDQFGYSIAISGDGNTIAVGAISEDSAAKGVNGTQGDDSASSAGAVYLFTRGNGTWTQQAYLKSGNNEAGDLFGYVVSLDEHGNALAVAAYDEDGSGRSVNPPDDNGIPGSGAIYAFERTNNVWRQTAYLKGSRSQRNDALGYTVAISADGNTIAAGTGEESCLTGGINPSGCDVDTFPSHLPAGSAGAVYVWTKSGNAWQEQAFLKQAVPDLEDWFGVRLAISDDGNTLLVGASLEDSAATGINGRQEDDTAQDAGAAYLFTRHAGSWRQHAYIKAANAEAWDEFGVSVALSGDGRTMVVGAPMEAGHENATPQAGAAYVFGVGN